MNFLNETAALETIQEMFHKTDTATIVVAFWGSGAVDKLGLRKPWKTLRVVCNLESGACNPSEIEELMALGDFVEVRSDPQLHGKVYLTERQLVLGSSNASSNGLVVEGTAIAGWAEANIVSTDAHLISQLRTWCDGRFAAAGDIDTEKLDLARAAWKARRVIAPAIGGLSTNLFASVRKEPDHPAFANIKLVQWARTITAHAEKAHRQAVEADRSLVGTDIYEGWTNVMEIGDWLIDFDVSRRPASFTGYWRVELHDEKNELTFVRKKPFIDIPTIGRLKISTEDMSRLKKALDATGGQSGGSIEKVTPIAQAVALLDTVVISARPKAFDKAMLAIYDEATEFGYYPNDFRSMVEKLGGVTTAKQLINKPKISQGFTRLWEEGRLDLSVEALAVSPEWRTLFSADEIKRSSQRLKEAGYKFVR
ncbi:phospholipase D family protein [Ensifer sp. ENS04]|uniref:phospholipase D family protein n=1 Tax=Ensifer sp. ENS04 TaxID=2769281 RepID=UPI001AEEA466|nr:phospholipase D family protein [Ensifer sp. ENS04]